jgi:hypothetical protein
MSLHFKLFAVSFSVGNSDNEEKCAVNKSLMECSFFTIFHFENNCFGNHIDLREATINNKF